MGAILLSVLIVCLWLRTAYHEFQLLIGVTADTPMLQHLTYIGKPPSSIHQTSLIITHSQIPNNNPISNSPLPAMTHSPMILSLDTVRAWHSGPRLIVEVDIVIDQQQTVKESHDCAEALQIKIESLPDVERAYVHIDYETSHAPEHFWKKEL